MVPVLKVHAHACVHTFIYIRIYEAKICVSKSVPEQHGVSNESSMARNTVRRICLISKEK